MTAPFLDPRRKRQILYNQAVIHAVDALRSGGQVGAGTLRRLQTTNAAGQRNVGVDPSHLLQAFAAQSPDNPNLAAARQAAVTGWTRAGLFAGPNAGSYQAPAPDAATAAQLNQPAPATAIPLGGPQALAARRSALLARTGPDAISTDLRKRILARMRMR